MIVRERLVALERKETFILKNNNTSHREQTLTLLMYVLYKKTQGLCDPVFSG
jgi:hypothetical protein